MRSICVTQYLSMWWSVALGCLLSADPCLRRPVGIRITSACWAKARARDTNWPDITVTKGQRWFDDGCVIYLVVWLKPLLGSFGFGLTYMSANRRRSGKDFHHQLKLFSFRQQDMPVTDRWMLSTVTLQWNSLMMTAVWPSTLSCHLKKQVERFIFMSDMSFHTLLNGKIGLFDLSFSVPAWLLPHRRKQAEFRLKCVKSEAVRFICNIRTIS